MRRHEGELLRYLLRASGNRADAADLFQETWLRAYCAYPRLDPDSNVRPWLYTIALNLCRNQARDGARRAAVIIADEEANPAAERIGNTPRAQVENDGYAAVRMREIISALPARQREALQLRYFAGLNYSEIAEVMKCSQQTARANVSQAQRKLKSLW